MASASNGSYDSAQCSTKYYACGPTDYAADNSTEHATKHAAKHTTVSAA